MSTDIKFPQGPIVDTTAYVTLEWQEWFLNPNFLSIVLGSPLGVESGGTGISSGTSGGVLYFVSSDEIDSSGQLDASALVLGGGAGNAPVTPVGLGTSVTVLHGNASGPPSWGKIVLTTDVSGILPVANGGTSLSSGTSGGVLGFTAAGTISSSAALTANAIVLGGGAGATPSTPVGLGTTTTVLHGNATGRPSFGAVVLSTDVSGNLPVTNLNAGSGANSATFWRGDGNWAQVTGNIVTGAALTTGNDTNVTLTTGGTPTTALLNAASITAGWTGTLGLSRGGTNADLSATGGASQVLRQSSIGAAVTVSQLAASNLSNGTTGSGSVVLAASPAFTGTATGAALSFSQGSTNPTGSLTQTAQTFRALDLNLSHATYTGTGMLLEVTRAASSAFDFALLRANSVNQFQFTGNGNLVMAGTAQRWSGYGAGALVTDGSGNITAASTLALARGGTNADLSATGGTSQVLQQASVGAAVTVGQLSTSSLSDVSTGTTATTFTWDGGGSPGTSGSVTLTCQKVGNFVTINIPAVSATTGTGSTTFTSNTAIAAGFRPASSKNCGVNVLVNGGAAIATPGVVQVNSAGKLLLFKDWTGAAFTNAASAGIGGETLISYYTG